MLLTNQPTNQPTNQLNLAVAAFAAWGKYRLSPLVDA
jgi:hypothetical protein